MEVGGGGKYVKPKGALGFHRSSVCSRRYNERGNETLWGRTVGERRWAMKEKNGESRDKFQLNKKKMKLFLGRYREKSLQGGRTLEGRAWDARRVHK